MDWTLAWELFGFAMLAAAITGIVCPIMGAFLLVRGTGFYGVALPQFATAGVVFGYALLPWWIANIGLAELELAEALESPHAVKNYALAWGGVFTFAGLFGLLVTSRRKELETARVAAAFAIASAATVLFALRSPTGSEFIEALLRGEILTIDLHEFETIVAVNLVVLILLALYRQQLVLVSFDRDMARTLRLPVRRMEGLLLFCTGLTVSVGVLIVGPIMLFGLLVLPPLAARGFAWSMRSFYGLSALFGLLAAASGIYLSLFAFDWPLGPAVVVAAATLLLPAALVARLRG